MRDIIIEEITGHGVFEKQIEVVERKGLGHPDFICDSIMEQVSVDLCAEYIKKTGSILHHNIDKGMLVAGSVDIEFGGGKIIEPMKIIFGDRATCDFNGSHIDVDNIAISAAKKWFSDNLRFVDCDTLDYQIELKPGSSELTDIFLRGGDVLGANDTSAAVGYAPATPTENIVLLLEKHLNSPLFKKQFPESGEDIKVMAYRNKDVLGLTVAMPLISTFVDSGTDYFRKKEELLSEIYNFARENSPFKVEVSLNTLDDETRGMGGVYLTLTGTSAEDGDCGQVGRGNRVNGIIPLNRPVSSEAAAGKNPVSHVGKIYNALSYRIAEQIYLEVPDLKEVYVWLLSQIGRPVDCPRGVAVQLLMQKDGQDILRGDVEAVVEKELDRMSEFCSRLVKGKIPIC